MSAIEIKQLKDKIAKLTEELSQLENEEEEDKQCRDCEIEAKKHCDECGGYGSDDDDDEVEEELTWQEKMKKYNLLVDGCVPKTCTKDEDLVVGDVVKHSFGCRDYKLMNVTRLTEKTIWYSECWTEKHRVRDSGGDDHTYGKFLGIEVGGGLNYKRKRRTKVLDNAGDEKWRGQRVWTVRSPNLWCGNIWIKEEESDIWR